MCILNIAIANETCFSIKSETLFLKNIVKELDFLGKQLLFNETFKRKVYCYLQAN